MLDKLEDLAWVKCLSHESEDPISQLSEVSEVVDEALRELQLRDDEAQVVLCLLYLRQRYAKGAKHVEERTQSVGEEEHRVDRSFHFMGHRGSKILCLPGDELSFL